MLPFWCFSGRREIANSKDFSRTFGVMLVEQYVIHVTYAPNIASTMVLLQKLILGLNNGMKPPSKVLNLITKLKKLILGLKDGMKPPSKVLHLIKKLKN